MLSPRLIAPVLVCFALLLASCGSGDPTVSNGPPGIVPQEQVVVSQISEGGVARGMLREEPACMNPYLLECTGAGQFVGVVFEAPLAVGEERRFKPYLIETVPSFEQGMLRENPFSVTLRLRAGISWPDGEPLTGEDVAWTYEQAGSLDEAAVAPEYAGWRELARAEVLDERTVRLTFSETRADWRTLLTGPILPRHVYEGRGFEELALDEDPVGSGPFTLAERTEGSLTFVKNENYWVEAQEPLPHLDGLEVEFQDSAAAAGALAEGRADFGVVGSRSGEGIEVTGNIQTAPALESVIQLVFNPERVPGEELRRAVAYGIDRERLARETGASGVAQSLFPPGSRYYAPDWERYGYDPERARSLAGGGEPLTLVYTDGNAAYRAAAEGVVRDLGEIGLRVEAREVSPAEALPGAEDFDLALGEAVVAPDGSLARYAAFASGAEELVSRSGGLLNEERRARAVREAQDALAGEAAVIPLVVRRDLLVWSNAFSGPRAATPVESLLWNVREWGFYR
jgi:peptide/nickel transport system substrate-binding protein